MGKVGKNLVLILGLVTISFGGYYAYIQLEQSGVSANQQDLQTMLNNTQVFIEREGILNQMELDLSIFENENFNSLRSYSTEIIAQPVGKDNPFETTSVLATESVTNDSQ